MRWILGFAALALSAAPALAQPYGGVPPRGSYERQCTNIRMNGSILSATCGGVRGGAESSINVLSCAGDIWVDAQGGLACRGPGVDPPGYGPEPGYRPPPPYAPGGGYGQITLYDGRGYRGQPFTVRGDIGNLDRTGFNDRTRSIRVPRRSGAWLVCTDAGYRGRCVTIDRSVRDTRDLGMWDAISSVRPAW